MEHFREKQKRHETWIQAAKDLATVCQKHGITHVYSDISTPVIKALFPERLPSCNCTDDGDQALGILPKALKNGRYQLRTLCYFCLLESTQNLRWDPIGKESVIFIFTNHFIQNPERITQKNTNATSLKETLRNTQDFV